MEHGYDSERGAAALAKMNEIHGRFKIANDDFLYPVHVRLRAGPRNLILGAYQPSTHARPLPYRENGGRERFCERASHWTLYPGKKAWYAGLFGWRQLT